MQEKKGGGVVTRKEDKIVVDSSIHNNNHTALLIAIITVGALLVFVAIVLALLFLYYWDNPLTFDKNIESAVLNSGKSEAYINLKEGIFNESVGSLKFIFIDKDSIEHTYTTNLAPGQFSFSGKTYDYLIKAEDVGLADFSGIRKIYLSLQYKSNLNQTNITPQTTTQNTTSNRTVRRTPSSQDSSSNSNNNNNTCIAKTCTNYTGKCGINYDDGCGGEISCLDNCGKGFYCYNGEGVESGLCLDISLECEDSDGLDEYTRGNYTQNSTFFEEYCQENSVLEYYCYYNGTSFEIRNKTIACALGCSNGECNYEYHPYILKRNFGSIKYNSSSLKGADSLEVQEFGKLFSGLINGSSASYYVEGAGDFIFISVGELDHNLSIKEVHEAFIDYYGAGTGYDYDSLEYYGFNGYFLAVVNETYGNGFYVWASKNKIIKLYLDVETAENLPPFSGLEESFMSLLTKYFAKHVPTLTGYCRDSDNGKDYDVRGYTEDYINESIVLGDRRDSCLFNSNKLNEQYCQDNLSVFEEYSCPIWCKEGKCIDFVDFIVCEDSDGGINYAKEGYTEMYYNVTGEKYAETSDRCFDSKDILEAFCNESIGIDYQEYDCSSEGKICVNNSCVNYFSGCGNNIIETGEVCDGIERGDLTCEDYGYNQGWIRGCCGNCQKPDLSYCSNETRTCKDHDGQNYYVASNVSYCYSSVSGESCQGGGGGGAGCYDAEDFCDDGLLYERTCTSEGYTDTVPYNCSKEGKVCSEGKCINISDVCTDFDGLNFYIKSNINFSFCHTWGECSNYTQYDCCNGNVLNEKTCLVTEFYPYADFNYKYNCSSEGKVCLDGACVDKFNGCGNNLMDAGETCDGLEMNGKKCQDFGYDNGTLKCCNSCNNYSFIYCYNETRGCIDYDGGINTTENSYAEFFFRQTYGPPDCDTYFGCLDFGQRPIGGSVYSWDSCQYYDTGSVLEEGICDANNHTAYVEYNCSIDGKVCYDGKCVYESDIELSSMSFIGWILEGIKSLLGLD